MENNSTYPQTSKLFTDTCRAKVVGGGSVIATKTNYFFVFDSNETGDRLVGERDLTFACPTLAVGFLYISDNFMLICC